MAEKGTDAWFYMSIEDLLPAPYKALAPSLRKGTDTMDVWFDSGSSWAAVVNQVRLCRDRFYPSGDLG